MTRFCCLLVLLSLFPAGLQAGFTVDFDTDSKWIRSPWESINTYSWYHRYEDQGMVFSGGALLRNTNSEVQGSPGALGEYAWRLSGPTPTIIASTKAPTEWFADYADVDETDNEITGFGFDIRRWDSDPEAYVEVDYTLDGTTFLSAGIVDHAFLGGDSGEN